MRAADHRAIRADVLRRDHGGVTLERQRELGVNGGRPCCGKAVRIAPEHPLYRACVCAWLEACSDHGLTHVGTHD